MREEHIRQLVTKKSGSNEGSRAIQKKTDSMESIGIVLTQLAQLKAGKAE